MAISTNINGEWLERNAVPNMRRQFDLNRDPYIAMQLLDLEKTEHQRRTETAGGMMQSDPPAPHLRPPPNIRDPVDQDMFNSKWLAAQRDFTMRHVDINRSNGREQEQNRDHSFTRTFSR